MTMATREGCRRGQKKSYPFISVGGLLSSMAGFVPCDRKLQRALPEATVPTANTGNIYQQNCSIVIDRLGQYKCF